MKTILTVLAMMLALISPAWANCVVMGDSIAVGLMKYRPDCLLVGRGGINTWQFNQMYPSPINADTVIISLATNDHIYIKTDRELERVRSRITARRVFWILPYGNLPGNQIPISVSQNHVRDIAARYGDVVIPITSVQADRIHPSWEGWRRIGEATR